MTPNIRAARRVVTEKSSSTKLTIQMPAYDAAGNLIVPMVDGKQVTYYLSGMTGSAVSNGTILWRAVNGTPDNTWSLGGGKGRVVLGSQGMTFSYYPTVNPENVTINLVATRVSGTRTDKLPTSQEVVPRNKDLCGVAMMNPLMRPKTGRRGHMLLTSAAIPL
jgi:hypothetical protein